MFSIKGHNINLNIQKNNINIKQTNGTFQILDKPPLPKKKKKCIKVLKHEYVCDQRRQNQLNARFIRKKQQLFQITRQNVRIFQKINSQKSIYSHQSLHKTYQSNKSLMNSRTSQRSNKSLNKSQISNYSKTSQKSHSSIKKNFYNRANSAKILQKSNTNKIIIRDVKRKSMVNLKPKGIQQTKAQDIQQFAVLFNIKEQPTKKQLNRPIRIKSTKNLKVLKNINSHEQKTPNMPKQIVINQENQIQIHEQIQVQQGSNTFRDKSSRAKSHHVDSKITSQSHLKQVMENNPKMNIISCQTQQNMKNSKRSLQSQKSGQIFRNNGENIQNLFQIKNNIVRSRLSKKLGNDKVVTKYQNLISKITNQLNKHNSKKLKQNSIFPYRSRLVA